LALTIPLFAAGLVPDVVRVTLGVMIDGALQQRVADPRWHQTLPPSDEQIVFRAPVFSSEELQ
jgi:hypothetical protein